ncbi:transglutaminase-like domain-containing protein [Bacteroides bouchesdurhonensis]
MNGIIGLVYITVSIGIVVYFFKKLIGLLLPKSKIYIYDDEGRKQYWGYVKYNRAQKKYRIFGQTGNILSKCMGEIQVKDDGMAWVRCWKRGYSPDELPYELGYINLEGRVFTSDHQSVGHVGQTSDTPETNGVTKWYEFFLIRHAEVFLQSSPVHLLFAHCMETGRFKRRKINQHTLLARAAAFISLYRCNDLLKPGVEESTVRIYAWGDTALLASVVFMGIYGLIYLMSPGYVMFPFIGERLSFLVAMLLLYLLTWAVMREIKIELSLDEKPIGWWLALLNANIGLSRLNWLIQVFAMGGLILSVFAFGGDFAPLMLALLIGIIVNERTYYHRVWDVQTRFAYLPDTTIIPPEDEGEIVRQYEWELDSNCDCQLRTTLKLRFKEADIAQLRSQNPFRQGNDFYNHLEHMFKEEIDRHHLAIINQHIASLSNEYRLTMLESIQFILDFVQEPNIRYAYDDESTSFTEYVRYPDETLFDKMGDCDCKAMLAAALFHDAGLRVLYITSDTHAAVAVECRPEWFGNWNNPGLSDGLLLYQGRYYYFCETTGDRFRVGDINGDISKFTYTKLIDIV